MIQFNVEGRWLELPADFSLQFKKTNILFAFDDASVERTTSFSIPATTTNNKTFAAANIIASHGTAMRKKFACQMIDGVTTKNGFLYIDEYDAKKDEYKAIFTTGELLNLQALKEAGKLPELGLQMPSISAIYNEAHVYPANGSHTNDPYAAIRYVTDAAPCSPSFQLDYLIKQAMIRINPSMPRPNTPAQYRILPQLLGAPENEKGGLRSQYTGVQPQQTESAAQIVNNLSIDALSPIVGFQSGNQVLTTYLADRDQYYRVRSFISASTIFLTFPDNFPADMFCMSIADKGTPYSDPEIYSWSADWFLGNYKFTRMYDARRIVPYYLKANGTPLAGRTIVIPARTPFLFASMNEYQWDGGAQGTFGMDGFQFSNKQTYNVLVTLEGAPVAVNETMYGRANLPDVTVIELLKIAAVIQGKVLNYTDAAGVTYDDLDLANWDTKNVTGRVIGIQSMSRKFGKWAQKNIIRFADNDLVRSFAHVERVYSIKNDNIEEENELLKAVVTEGDYEYENGTASPVVVFNSQNSDEFEIPAAGIMQVTSSSEYARRVALPANATIERLCEKSTSVKMHVRMSHREFDDMASKTLILNDGTLYVWTSAEWSKDVATLSLSAV